MADGVVYYEGAEMIRAKYLENRILVRVLGVLGCIPLFDWGLFSSEGGSLDSTWHKVAFPCLIGDFFLDKGGRLYLCSAGLHSPV